MAAFAVSGTSLYAGGSFTAYQGVAASAEHLAKLDLTSGALDTPFSPSSNGFDATLDALGINSQYTELVVGGAFTVYRGSTTLSRSVILLDPSSGAEK